MTSYYRLEPDIYDRYGIVSGPTLPSAVSFLSGRVLREPVPAPLVFETNYPDGTRPRHFLGRVIPVVSKQFLETLRALGVDNFQSFPAVLRNGRTGAEWPGYYAFNVVGLVDPVDAEASRHQEIMAGGDGESEPPPLLHFTELAFAASKTGSLPLFRLLQHPTEIFIIDRVKEQLVARKPEGGWGITTTEIPVTNR